MLRPCNQGKRHHWRHEILELGSNNNSAQQRICSIFSQNPNYNLLYDRWLSSHLWIINHHVLISAAYYGCPAGWNRFEAQCYLLQDDLLTWTKVFNFDTQLTFLVSNPPRAETIFSLIFMKSSLVITYYSWSSKPLGF